MPFHAPWQAITIHRLPNRYISQPKTRPMMKMSPIENHGSDMWSSAQAADVTTAVPETSSAGLLGLTAFLTMRRRRRAV